MEWNKVYEMYPVNENMIWLNNCGITPAGAHIVRALEDYFKGFAQKGPWYAPDLPDETRNRIKKILSGLLNCETGELALIHNTAEGMNFISYGYPVHPGDEVILLENEYPSNVYPWRELEKRGARLVVTPMEENPERFLAEFEKRVTAKTKMAALSAVHWCTGMPLPMEEIGEICRQNKVELVVDGAQGVGMQPIDVKKCGISYMAFSAWKWLMGPLGMGVLYISRDRLDKLEPVFMATESVVDDKEYLPYKNELKPTADRYTYSTPNVTELIYLDAALKF